MYSGVAGAAVREGTTTVRLGDSCVGAVGSVGAGAGCDFDDAVFGDALPRKTPLLMPDEFDALSGNCTLLLASVSACDCAHATLLVRAKPSPRRSCSLK